MKRVLELILPARADTPARLANPLLSFHPGRIHWRGAFLHPPLSADGGAGSIAGMNLA